MIKDRDDNFGGGREIGIREPNVFYLGSDANLATWGVTYRGIQGFIHFKDLSVKLDVCVYV